MASHTHRFSNLLITATTNSPGVERLAGVVLAEQHNEWIQQKYCMSLTILEQTKARTSTNVIDAGEASQEIA